MVVVVMVVVVMVLAVILVVVVVVVGVVVIVVALVVNSVKPLVDSVSPGVDPVTKPKVVNVCFENPIVEKASVISGTVENAPVSVVPVEKPSVVVGSSGGVQRRSL